MGGSGNSTETGEITRTSSAGRSSRLSGLLPLSMLMLKISSTIFGGAVRRLPYHPEDKQLQRILFN